MEQKFSICKQPSLPAALKWNTTPISIKPNFQQIPVSPCFPANSYKINARVPPLRTFIYPQTTSLHATQRCVMWTLSWASPISISKFCCKCIRLFYKFSSQSLRNWWGIIKINTIYQITQNHEFNRQHIFPSAFCHPCLSKN